MIHRVFFLLIVCAGISIQSCTGKDRPDIPASREVILAKITDADSEHLKTMDSAALDIPALLKKRPGAAYYLAYRFKELDIPEQAEILFRDTFRYDRDPWKKEGGLALGVLLEEKGSARELLEFSREFIAAYPKDAAGRVLFLTALYQNGRDEELRENAAAFTENDLYTGGTGAVILLLRAMADKRLGGREWADSIRTLFLIAPAEEVHGKALAWVNGAEGGPGAFSRRERDFFRAKADLAEKNYDQALNGYRGLGPALFDGEILIREYGEILQKTGRFREGVREIEDRLPRLESERLLAAKETLGKLYRLSGQYEKSVAVLKKALDIIGREKPEELMNIRYGNMTDRVIWYILSSSLRRSSEGMIKILPVYLPVIKNPVYFSDLFEQLASILVQRRAWAGLHRVYEAMRDHTTPADSGRYAFLLALAVHKGLYTPPAAAPLEVRDLLGFAADHGEEYYRILSSVALGRPVVFREDRDAALGAEEISLYDLYVRGFIDFHLSRRGVESARRNIDRVSPETVISIAKSEAAQGRYLDSLRLLHRTSRRQDFQPTRLSLEILYPLAYQKEMEEVLREAPFPAALFYGLVREESYFDASIESQAGAVGLSQLMPATARDVARKMKIQTPRLTDPLTNLRLGSRYFKDLYARFGNGVDALAGYNAGSNRISRWRRQFRGLPDALFVEAIPFTETREYIRKVLVSAVHYGYLYGDTPPGDMVSRIISGFLPE
jgi:tetratricopeptide (TPR) repeat protein